MSAVESHRVVYAMILCSRSKCKHANEPEQHAWMTSFADHHTAFAGLQVYHGDKSRDNIKALEPSGSQRQADVNGLSSTVYQQPPLQQQPGQVLPHNELSASGMMITKLSSHFLHHNDQLRVLAHFRCCSLLLLLHHDSLNVPFVLS